MIKGLFVTAIFLGSNIISAQQVTNYNYHDAFAPGFIQKTLPKLVRQAVSQVQNIGKTELIIR